MPTGSTGFTATLAFSSLEQVQVAVEADPQGPDVTEEVSELVCRARQGENVIDDHPVTCGRQSRHSRMDAPHDGAHLGDQLVLVFGEREALRRSSTPTWNHGSASCRCNSAASVDLPELDGPFNTITNGPATSTFSTLLQVPARWRLRAGLGHDLIRGNALMAQSVCEVGG